jgi:hypothetical protein
VRFKSSGDAPDPPCDLVDPIVPVHHGWIVKSTCDDSVAEFRCVEAVRCNIEIQRDPGACLFADYSTVTDFARLRGWSASLPMMTGVW